MRSRPSLDVTIVAAATAGLTLLYCLRHGTYDVVTRGELGLLIWIALGLGWAAGVLPRAQPARVLWPAVAGFAALALWTTVCLRWTESDERTVIELGRVMHHAGVFLLAASLLTRRTWRAALGGLLLGLTIVAWLGLCNWLWPGSIATDYTRKVFGVNRLSYPLGYFNAMATLGAMTVVGLLAAAAHAGHRLLRAAAMLALPGVVVMAYLTYSRGGVIELAAGLVVVLAVARQRAATLVIGLVAGAGSALTILALRDHQSLVQGTGSDAAGTILAYTIVAGVVAAAAAAALAGSDDRLRLPPRVGRPALAGFAAVVLIAGVIAAPTVVKKAGKSFSGAQTNSVTNPTERFTTLGSGRYQQFKAAVAIWHEHPTEGTGPGTFEFSWNRDPRYNGFVRDAHNLYLEALSESGWPGLLATLVALIGMAAAILLAAVRAADGPERGAATAAAAIFAVFVVAAAVDWVWELTALAFAALCAAGAAAGSLSSGRYRRALRPGRLLVPAAGIAALIALLPTTVSRSEVRSSQAAARAHDPAAALRHADDAIDAAPWAATALVQKSLLFEDAGKLSEAEGYAILAMRREPTNWRYPLLRARLAAEQGDARAAVRWFRAARALAPKKPLFG